MLASDVDIANLQCISSHQDQLQLSHGIDTVVDQPRSLPSPVAHLDRPRGPALGLIHTLAVLR